jgi:hypothetical protein
VLPVAPGDTSARYHCRSFRYNIVTFSYN